MAFAINFLVTFTLFVGLSMILVAAELAFPMGKLPSNGARWRAFLFSTTYLLAAALTGLLVSMALRSMGIRPLLSGVGTVIAIIVTVFGVDFLKYWLHRAQHRYHWLWRVHGVHHSIREMSAPSGYQHVLEPLFQSVLCGVPIGLIVASPQITPVAVFLTLHGFYLHSSTWINFGPFRFLISDNRAHRIHHSLDHVGYNFGVTTMLWDWLFRTAHFPRKDEWPAVGIEGLDEPKTMAEYMMLPFRLNPPV